MNRKTRDTLLIVAFIIADIGVFWAAYQYFSGREPTSEATDTRQRTSPAEERSLLDQFQRTARSGDWERMESVRKAESERLDQKAAHPSPSLMLYFFPEKLPSTSFEYDFAESELLPALHGLRQAHESQSSRETTRAFKLLESRVTNYELGASSDNSNLSPEAQGFLRTYGILSGQSISKE